MLGMDLPGLYSFVQGHDRLSYADRVCDWNTMEAMSVKRVRQHQLSPKRSRRTSVQLESVTLKDDTRLACV